MQDSVRRTLLRASFGLVGFVGALGASTCAPFSDDSATPAVDASTDALLDDGACPNCDVECAADGLDGKPCGDAGKTCFEHVCGGGAIVSFSAVRSVCVALKSGSVWCWGIGSSGQTGLPSTAGPLPTPSRVQGISDAVEVSVGLGFACARSRPGKVYCWGSNLESQLGHDPALDLASGCNNACNHVAVEVPGLMARQVGTGQEHACAVTPVGDVYCWGSVARLGLDAGGPKTFTPTKVEIPGNPTVSRLALFFQHACAIVGSPGNVVYCWGDNSTFALGDTCDAGSVCAPAPLPGQPSTPNVVSDVAASSNATCVLYPSGSVRCVGRGSLFADDAGAGSLTDIALPGKPVHLAGRSANFCVVDDVGKVYCWGSNQYWNQGRRETSTCMPGGVECPTPAEVPGINDAVAVDTHTVTAVLRRDGSLWTWGNNGSGSLGHVPNAADAGDVPCQIPDASLVCNPTPTPMPGLPTP